MKLETKLHSIFLHPAHVTSSMNKFNKKYSKQIMKLLKAFWATPVFVAFKDDIEVILIYRHDI